ncbi:sensor domain-containing diguanylate cyclase [Vibrio sp. dsl-7]|uniref:diguanylate cyclase n=1 Tax=Vibrio chanodichtyis TaxID=3027932 RepID=A0ABT5V0V4_9VIBR|nr:sensor domain-containing diguanylate cyclase [Vibrio chanodichtyis]MDE1513960.1 sensor domain-containing diguanylate cyclase [Vibrio chanodichtyis]
MLAETSFEYLITYLQSQAAAIVRAPSQFSTAEVLFSDGDFVGLEDYPEVFWVWAAQFDTSDGVIPFAINTCRWDYLPIMGGESFILMLDNHPQHRTYLIIQAVCAEQVHLCTQSGELDFLQLIAAKWQCLRAEIEASKEFKNRDLREAKYLSEIRQREQFIDNMKLVHQVAVELSNPASLDELHRAAVEAMRNRLGFDRAAFLLLDLKKRCFSGTYGTDESGNTIDEHHTQYDLHQVERQYLEALSNDECNLMVVEAAPLYTAGQVVGQGWNGMLILRDGNETIGWIAIDNYIHRQPITEYQKQMLESFSSLLAQIYIRMRQEQNVRMLHASMVELSRCMTVSQVCKSAVNFAINRMGIDRMAIFLTDEACSYLQGTWGTDMQGNIVDESYFRGSTHENDVVDLAKLQPNQVVFKENVPIYHDCKIVGYGWTAMTMLTDKGTPIAFISVDNLIRCTVLTSQLREVIRMFASNLTEVLMRAKAQEAISVLNATLELEVRNRTRDLHKANQQLDLMAKLDPLTRLGNRRMLDHLLEQTCEQATGEAVNYGVILLDLDHFGLFNNCYGHLEGDIALMRIGNILSQHAQSERELFCRIGGEEFLLLIAHRSVEEIQSLAESIRYSIAAERILHQQNPDGELLTVSIGYAVSRYKPCEVQFDQLYAEADKALYQAKSQGRNQVVGVMVENVHPMA